ncbi:heavy-metal transporting CPx-type ATPase [Halostagnicola larsenii XH-48]|uniref:Heavy-metal transporting CPx-type ATPase n=1 Tax=Halostagnicola larsenii XH-48 TaxID=797299 RepID=W0JR66_9EURY|nr:cation-translocating P-type ATPase [Halostagnicola larsenii]AHF99664.1 heavy-metal transporting CPx-type ATPase [Halostagnicola larsenii XH-48]
MTDTETTADGCTLCELPTEGVDVSDGDGNEFCCVGCRDVYEALGDVEDIEAEDVRERRAESDGDDALEAGRDVPDDHEATYLEVDGMHCATCEAFIESAAERTDGVSNASSSYVTDTVRIDHDPETVSEAELRDSISGLGYSAYSRDDAFSRRQADNWAIGRVIVGVLMGMMVMLQYVVLIYPVYFGGLFYDEGTMTFIEDALAHESAAVFYLVIAALTTIILLVTGKPILQGAYVSAKTRRPNMDLLVAIAALSAYVYSTLAVITGGQHIYYDVTVAIIVIVSAGGYYESSIKRKATERLSDLTAVQVDQARRVRRGADASASTSASGTEDGLVSEDVPLEDLESGDHVLVRTGERIPIDGEVVDGDASVDEAVVTGESLPVRKTLGDDVVGGSMVADGALTVRVGPDATSSLDRITELVWDLQSGTHGIQKLADKLATIFVPVVLALAVVVTAVRLVLGAGVTDALLDGLTVLIVSCPCALGLATPLAVAAGIRDALENSIVVFDDSVFERIRNAETIVFDKTGTLTTGEMSVVETISNASTDDKGLDASTDDSSLDSSLLEKAAALESQSAHPIGRAIATAWDRPERITDGGTSQEQAEVPDDGNDGRELTAYEREQRRTVDDLSDPQGDASADSPGDEPIDSQGNESGGSLAGDPASAGSISDSVESFESHRNGVSGVVDGEEVVVGHPDLFAARGWTVPETIAEQIASARETGRVPVAVGRDGAAEGAIVVGDELREEWDETLTAISEADIDIVVLTGDDARAADRFREEDAIDRVFAGVPPEGKAETVERLKQTGETVMVGDGTNDAPALAAADLGISLGGGTAMAADAADVALVDDDLSSVETVFELARATDRRVKTNIGWAFCYNGVAIPLAVAGVLNPLFAAVAMGASSLLVVTNSARSLLEEE